MSGFARKLAKKAEGFIAPEISGSHPTHGFRIVYVEPDSEAFHAGLEPLFDFVVAVNGQRFDQRYFGDESGDGNNGHRVVSVEQEQSPFEDFEIAVADTKERSVLEVWTAKGKSTRLVSLPNPAKQAHGLGFEVKWYPLSVADHVWHILNVVPQSPAAAAGLVSHADYIVASENGDLEAMAIGNEGLGGSLGVGPGGEQALGRLISRARNTRDGVSFYVYNRDYDVVRPVRVIPTSDGKLGCGVGYGLLHALPKVAADQSSHAPGSMSFNGDQAALSDIAADPLSESESLEPAANLIPQIPTDAESAANTSTLTQSAYVPHNTRHHGKPTSALTDYFNEQSKSSHQIDGSITTKANAPPPPPPKKQ